MLRVSVVVDDEFFNSFFLLVQLKPCKRNAGHAPVPLAGQRWSCYDITVE